ncbi:hypothetical protein V501_03119 [Pseudogymnoascus sp. VKM F-4519 (FW-2642)]|nr:hypothetical protein V501_03119 [Pseudogymnoascus sp. VKM F-4519 (FW-2642)]
MSPSRKVIRSKCALTPIYPAFGRYVADRATSTRHEIYLNRMSAPSSPSVFVPATVSQDARPRHSRIHRDCAPCRPRARQIIGEGPRRRRLIKGVCAGAIMRSATSIYQDEICEGVPQPSRSAEVIKKITIIAAVTFPIIILRFLSRSLVSNKLELDDWAVAVAGIFMIPMVIIPIYNATLGFGKHFWDVPPKNIILLRKVQILIRLFNATSLLSQLYYISQIFYVTVQSLAKVSILLLYLRIFPAKRFRLVTNIALGWMVCRTLAFIGVLILQCIPVELSWDITVPGKCANSQVFVYVAAAFSIFEDFVIMLLPVWELKDLTLSGKKRMGLIFMFALGSFACITSMIRLKYIVSYGTSIDLTYANVDAVIWSVLESFTAVICASLMCLRPLIVKFLRSAFPTTHISDIMRTPTPGWPRPINVKLASKLRDGNYRFELHSQGNEMGGGSYNVIRVQKSWVTKTHPATKESIKMQGRSSLPRSKAERTH